MSAHPFEVGDIVSLNEGQTGRANGSLAIVTEALAVTYAGYEVYKIAVSWVPEAAKGAGAKIFKIGTPNEYQGPFRVEFFDFHSRPVPKPHIEDSGYYYSLLAIQEEIT